MQEIIEKLEQDINSELNWRLEELDLYQKPLRFSVFSDAEENIYYKSLIAMLYAHFEGYVKFCLISYVNSLNSLNLTTEVVLPQIVINTLDVQFEKLGNTNHKEPSLESKSHDNGDVQKFWRRVEFYEKAKINNSSILKIDEKSVTTKSNLDPAVLRYLLYKLGFPLDAFDKYSGQIHKLLGYRNEISHGGKSINHNFKEVYSEISTDILKVMLKIQILLIEGIQKKIYLKNPSNI